MDSTRRRLTFLRYLGEVTLILLGVFLGLFVNEIRIEQRDQRRAQQSVTHLLSELQHNTHQIDRFAEHHVAVRDTLNHFMEQVLITGDSPSLPDLWQAMSGGLGIPPLRQTSWSLANRLGTLEHLDYETSTLLSRAYDLQDFYLSKYDRLADNFYLAVNMAPDSRAGLAMALAVLANDIVIHEEDLLVIYAKAIAHLQARE